MKLLFKGVFWIIIFIVIFAVIGRIFFFKIGKTDSYSMVPGLIAGDVFLVMTVGKMGLGDVAVCQNPEHPSSMIVGRIMGVPGTTIEQRGDVFLINNEEISHPSVDGSVLYADNTSGENLEYIASLSPEFLGGHAYEVGIMERGFRKDLPRTEVTGGFFLVGDNRNLSRDSRNFGEVPVRSCIGEAMVVLWPSRDSGDFKRMKRIASWID
ncbi:MAG: signal peptidase I [Deltaproteobacteria bacterium]|nr:signal peptidase I [Deltaproteobacteria bacterium]